MQIFIPYPDLFQSVQVLDFRRLGKQRLEARDISYLGFRTQNLDLRRLYNYPDHQADFLWKRYRNHPCVHMWVGHEDSVLYYAKLCCERWIQLGYKDTVMPKVRALSKIFPVWYRLPEWFGDDAIHQSHRSNLLRKSPSYYQQFWPTEPSNLPYKWVKSNNAKKEELCF